MLRNRIFNNASDALMHYGEKRTHDQKGVTIPSQRRYVEYYSHLLNSGQPYSRIPLQVRKRLFDIVYCDLFDLNYCRFVTDMRNKTIVAANT